MVWPFSSLHKEVKSATLILEDTKTELPMWIVRELYSLNSLLGEKNNLGVYYQGKLTPQFLARVHELRNAFSSNTQIRERIPDVAIYLNNESLPDLANGLLQLTKRFEREFKSELVNK